MASTSIIYRNYPELKPLAVREKETYDMKEEDPGVVSNIEKHQTVAAFAALELLRSRLSYRAWEEYNRAFDYIVNQNRPVLLCMAHKDPLKEGTHAVVGYMILDLGDVKRVYVI